MKKSVLVVFGGQSSEHIVSCMSAINVIKNIDTERYDVTLIGITEEGKWLLVDSVEQIEDESWRKNTTTAILSPDATEKSVIVLKDGKAEMIRIDVVFPVLHGLWGEDGTIQGIFELAKIPYVGCGVLASSVSMDKVYTKQIVDHTGVRQAAYELVIRKELEKMDEVVARIENRFSYPVFIKPSNAGSSRGVSKASDREELIAGLKEAAHHDRKILVEETIVGREIECAVLGYGKNTKASRVGEILAAAEFYDFDAKYNNAESKTVIGADLPDGKEAEVQKDAVAIFNALDGFGLSRVDFFLEKDTNEVVFNEINTLPGFTSISMYPMLWKDKGYSIESLVETLIEMAKERP